MEKIVFLSLRNDSIGFFLIPILLGKSAEFLRFYLNDSVTQCFALVVLFILLRIGE